MKRSPMKNPVPINELVKMAMESLQNRIHAKEIPQEEKRAPRTKGIKTIGKGKNQIHDFLNAA